MKGIIRAQLPVPLYIITIISLVFLPGCITTKTSYSGITTVRKYQKNIPFVFKNNISLQTTGASKDEKVIIQSKLNTQLDDSAKVIIKDKFFFLHYINNPPAFDTNAVFQSASNMRTALVNIGYYSPQVHYSFDTVLKKGGAQKRIITNYEVVLSLIHI